MASNTCASVAEVPARSLSPLLLGAHAPSLPSARMCVCVCVCVCLCVCVCVCVVLVVVVVVSGHIHTDAQSLSHVTERLLCHFCLSASSSASLPRLRHSIRRHPEAYGGCSAQLRRHAEAYGAARQGAVPFAASSASLLSLSPPPPLTYSSHTLTYADVC